MVGVDPYADPQQRGRWRLLRHHGTLGPRLGGEPAPARVGFRLAGGGGRDARPLAPPTSSATWATGQQQPPSAPTSAGPPQWPEWPASASTTPGATRQQQPPTAPTTASPPARLMSAQRGEAQNTSSRTLGSVPTLFSSVQDASRVSGQSVVGPPKESAGCYDAQGRESNRARGGLSIRKKDDFLVIFPCLQSAPIGPAYSPAVRECGTSRKPAATGQLARGLRREGRIMGQGGANIFLHCLLLSFPLLLPGVWKLGLRRSLNQLPYPSYLNLSLPSARSPLGVGPPTL